MRRLIRRAAALLVMAVTAAACNPAAEVPPRLDPALWEQYRARFVENGRVVDRDNGGITHSESQGYGMLLAEAAGDRDTFDALWAWTGTHLARGDGLLSWRWEPGAGVTDRNNATDGEILVAWALLRAAARWDENDYAAAARPLIGAVRDKALVEHDGYLLLLPGVEGFRKPEGPVVNPSYWVFPALTAFAEAGDAATWERVAAAGEQLIAEAGVPPTSLVPDWVQMTAAGPRPAPDFPPQFAWNAVRVPLHVAWTAKPRRDLLVPYVAFWRGAGDGTPPPAWIDLVTGETAEYTAPAGIRAIAAVTEAAAAGRAADPAALPVPGEDDGYFSWSLALLARLAATRAAGEPDA